jgi:hypothetical protein
MLQELEEEARSSWEERAVFYATQVTDILGAGWQERSSDSAPGAGCLGPVASDRSRGIGDLGMAVYT